ncbi:copper amine oxidase [Apodospora peruviana]|uniref:Amine oxidase n=1 Tax=Apodospora peruviana TaxID=516989 RepID=A0AAE0MGF1_9PEZI|nr:copper amine oxidase [Apodospora peruviana]
MCSYVHPFDPLTPKEIQLAAGILRRHVTATDILFRVIALCEPPKEEMMVFLDNEHGIPHDTSAATPTRCARIQAYVDKKFCEFKINLDDQIVVSKDVLEGRHSHIDPGRMRKVELACLADPRVKEKIAALKLPDEATVVVEPWTYGTDGMNDMSKLVTMCWFYLRVSADPDANFYAFPLPLSVEMSSGLEVAHIFHLPLSDDDETDQPLKRFDHNNIHSSSEYHPNLSSSRRATTKPYHVVQPEGPSFSVQGNLITWEKWTLRVGFNYREGMTLHDIRYDDRSLFYRLSLSEMFVPYGDPRTPYPRKAAFDLGNDGAGICANNLQLGCDCLGHIKYFDGYLTTNAGIPLKLPNVICCHEIDDGILWKHTNFRTGNAVVTRARQLVLQTIMTASNYEYIFCFYFGQDASLTYEVRATGILSTAPISSAATTSRYGTIVAPGVMAPNHQHLFCLRIDPAIDGWNNSLQVEESVPLQFSPGSPEENPFGMGYTTNTQIVPHETGLDLNHLTNRIFKIVNEEKVNGTTGTAVGYKLVPFYSQPLLAHASSFHARRSEFASHAVWVTRYHEEEMFPAGKFTMQSAGGEGIASWIESRRGRGRELGGEVSGEVGGDGDGEDPSSVRNKDIVIWHSFGSTHNPRVEDWPVMPCEKMSVGLKSVNFFERNPALDVPISTQEKNLSVLVIDGSESGDGQEGKEDSGRRGCC